MSVKSCLREGIYWLAAWLFAILYVASYQFADPDLWGRLSIGALYFQNHGRFPYRDLFSYTAPNAPWIDHEWLTGLVFYQVLYQWGEAGFLAFKYLLVLAIFTVLACLHRSVYKASPLYCLYGLIMTVGTYSVGLYSTIRSHVFSFFFFVLFLFLLERVRTGQKTFRSLWLLLPLGVLWGNLHGGVAMGLVLLLLYGVGEGIANRSVKTGASYALFAIGMFLLLGLINPYGFNYLQFLVHAWTLDRSHIGEWSQFRFERWEFLPGQCLLMGCWILLLLHWQFRDRQNPERLRALVTPALVLLGISAMVIKGVRFQPFLAWTAVAYAPLLFPATLWQRLLPKTLWNLGKKQASAFANTLPALLLFGSLGGLLFLQGTIGLFRVPLADEMSWEAHPQIRYPLGLVECLRAAPLHGNLVVRFGLGEFAYWALYPQYKVSMDGRYEEVYSQDEFLRNHHFYDIKEPIRSQNALRQVEASPADFILTEPKTPSTALLFRSRDWELLNGNNYYLLFARKASLAKQPTFDPKHTYTVFNVRTIQDYFTPSDLARFRLKSPNPQ